MAPATSARERTGDADKRRRASELAGDAHEAVDSGVRRRCDQSDGDREYACERDPILGNGTEQIQAAAATNDWTVIDMAADWSTVHPPAP
jgi:hypothetical protein